MEQRNKMCRVWSERREREIALRVYYSAYQNNGCKIINLKQLEELG